LILYFDTL